jgi:hypothetical protein
MARLDIGGRMRELTPLYRKPFISEVSSYSNDLLRGQSHFLAYFSSRETSVP